MCKIINYVSTTFNKIPIKDFWSVKWTQFFQEMGKTKFHATKICVGPSAHHIFELLLYMCLGVQFCTPPPIKIGLTLCLPTVLSSTIRKIYKMCNIFRTAYSFCMKFSENLLYHTLIISAFETGGKMIFF